MVEPSAMTARLRRFRASPATYALSLACGLAFVGTIAMCGVVTGGWAFVARALWRLDGCTDTLVDLGGLAVARVWLDGEWWRVLTAGLLHGSGLHVILNVWSLVVVGEWAERAFGSGRLLLCFGLTSVAGCLASQAYAEAPLVVGASAGIMGLAGALLIVRWLGRGPAALRLDGLSARGLAIAVGILVVLGFVVPVIAQAGHLGGLAAGFAMGWAWTQRRGAWLGWAALVGLGGGLSWGAASPSWRPAHDEYIGFELLARGEDARGAAALERALAARPGDPELSNAVAYAYAEAGVQLGRAQDLVQVALEADPDRADYLDTLGWIHCRAGRPEEGIALLQRASEAAEGGIDEIQTHLETCEDGGPR